MLLLDVCKHCHVDKRAYERGSKMQRQHYGPAHLDVGRTARLDVVHIGAGPMQFSCPTSCSRPCPVASTTRFTILETLGEFASPCHEGIDARSDAADAPDPCCARPVECSATHCFRPCMPSPLPVPMELPLPRPFIPQSFTSACFTSLSMRLSSDALSDLQFDLYSIRCAFPFPLLIRHHGNACANRST